MIFFKFQILKNEKNHYILIAMQINELDKVILMIQIVFVMYLETSPLFRLQTIYNVMLRVCWDARILGSVV
jgi:hypothetical protein